MSKLLQGTLPFSPGETVRSEIYNKSVRLLELSLGAVDPDATPQFTSARRDELSFQAGDIIWNTTEGVLQVYLGDSWQNISTPTTSGLSATASLGEIQVIASGSIVVEVG